MIKLCKDCTDALENRLNTPTHLVYSNRGAAMVFDICGVAACPSAHLLQNESQQNG